MPVVVVDSRPSGVDLLFRPGNALTVTLTWPAGSLTGRTFTSTLGATTLDLAIQGDVMTVEVSAEQTSAVTDRAVWTLTETTAGASDDVLVGTWVPDDGPQSITSRDLTVTAGQADITVTVSSDQASMVAHLSTLHRPHVEIPSAWGQRWHQVRTEADTRQVKAHFWGDSNTEGQGASNKDTLGYAGLVRDALRDAYGDGGTGFLPIGTATQTGVWFTVEPWGVGMGGALGTATSAASLQWTGLRGTRVRVFFRNANIAGSFRWRVDGGAWNTVTPPTGFGVEPGMAEATGLADVPHTVDVEWLSGAAGIHGVLCDRPTGIVAARCASGLAASQFSAVPLDTLQINITNGSATITNAAPGRFDSSLVGQYVASVSPGLPVSAQITAVASAASATISSPATATGSIQATIYDQPPAWRDAATQTVDPVFATGLGRPDLVIVALGVNDQANVRYTAATVRAGIGRILSPYFTGADHDFTPDVVFLVEHRGNYAFDVTGQYPAITAAVVDVARSVGAAIVDVWGIGRRSFRYWDDLGYFDDAIHPSDAGHAAYAAPLIELLTA